MIGGGAARGRRSGCGRKKRERQSAPIDCRGADTCIRSQRLHPVPPQAPVPLEFQQQLQQLQQQRELQQQFQLERQLELVERVELQQFELQRQLEQPQPQRLITASRRGASDAARLGRRTNLSVSSIGSL